MTTPIPVHLNDTATTNETFSSWWWTEKTKYGKILMYFCPRKNGPVQEGVQVLKSWQKIPKLLNSIFEMKRREGSRLLTKIMINVKKLN
jgi:hypothetical protein